MGNSILDVVEMLIQAEEICDKELENINCCCYDLVKQFRVRIDNLQFIIERNMSEFNGLHGIEITQKLKDFHVSYGLVEILKQVVSLLVDHKKNQIEKLENEIASMKSFTNIVGL